MNITKTKILSLIAFLTLCFSLQAQVDRTKKPIPGPAPQVKLGTAEKFKLKNGLTVILVENLKLPRASATLTIDNAPVSEGNKAGVSSIMGSLLGRGTPTITKDDFNERVDFLGATIRFGSSSAYASSLKKYFTEVLTLMADGVKNSQFTQEEFEKEQKITLDAIKSSAKSVSSIARRVENVLTYGAKHPFGEFTSKETVKNITLADIKENYNTYYKPNNAYLIVQGDIDAKAIKKLIKSLFSDWQSGNIPLTTIPETKNVTTTEINFVNMDNAVQSEIAITNNIDLQVGDKDYFAALIANKILGGGATARLYANLREDKGYTYGSYSRLNQSRHATIFKATASVRNIVTDSSVVEMMKEINKIRYDKITAEELKQAKAEYVGNFVINVQKPSTVARFALNKELYNLPDDFYENYLKNINAVTVDDVQNAAIKYFKGNKARIVITGKGIDVLDNLEKTDYVIKYFDDKGNPTTKPPMTIPVPKGTTATNVVNKYLEAIGGKENVMAIHSVMMVSSAKVQGIAISAVDKIASPNKMSKVISGMGQVFQKIVFDGEKGYQEVQGRRIDMTKEQLEEIKNASLPFIDISYKEGKVDRIEPIAGKNYFVIKHNNTDAFYDMKSGLKYKEVRKAKGPQGNDMKIPTTYTNYKAVNGVLFPYKISSKMGPMDLNFEIKEIKINEGVTDEDFK